MSKHDKINLEEKVLVGLKKPRDLKERCSFTIAGSVKKALSDWCLEKGVKESNAVEEMIRQVIPNSYFDKQE